jgi:hypothetical protein
MTLRPPLLRILDYGLAAGCDVDLLVWDCAKLEDIVAALPPRTRVLNRGATACASGGEISANAARPDRACPVTHSRVTSRPHP